MPEDFCAFTSVLFGAAARVAESYFQLPVAGSEDSRYRERVYTYELYHQLRASWPAELARYSLGGEVDKTGHPLVRGGKLEKAKPDLLVHVPGIMDHNLAVVEVKAALPADSDVRKDIAKLSAFCDPVGPGYVGGIFLVYGTASADEGALMERFSSALDDYKPMLTRIHLALHRRPGDLPVILDWSQSAA